MIYNIGPKSMKKVLIFAKSADSSHSLAVLLQQFGLSVDELSSKVSLEPLNQPSRNESYADPIHLFSLI